MNVLFLTLVQFNSLKERGIYTDLLREFVKHGHKVYAISPVEKRQEEKTHIIKEPDCTILRLQTGNAQKIGVIEKGISTVLIEPAFKTAIKKYFSDIRFDLVLYSTPPITLTSAVEYVKKRDGAKTYLLLKDIFPQNAVDIGMMSDSGIVGLLYRHFRKQEKNLYKISDRIGCMSQANVEYLLKHDPEIAAAKIEVCPNSIEVSDTSVSDEARIAIRQKYGIPFDKKVFVYGGNLGKPQGIPFLIECLRRCRDIDEAFFLVAGDGTEYDLIKKYTVTSGQKNLKLMRSLPREDYETLVGACDVGLIFLDHRFKIPNFPSRLLSYMQARLPVIACTDPNTDIGKVIEEGGFGWQCESNDVEAFRRIVLGALKTELSSYGDRGFDYMLQHYSVESAYEVIDRSIKECSTKKKALVISCFNWYKTRLEPICGMLSERGFDVNILIADFDHIKKKPIETKYPECTYISVPHYKRNMSAQRIISHLSFGRAAAKEIDTEKPDLIYLQVPPNNTAEFCVKYKKNHPGSGLILDIIDLWPESMPVYSFKNFPAVSLWRKWRDNCIPYADHIFTECRLYQEKLGLDASKTSTLYLFKEQSEEDSRLVSRIIEERGRESRVEKTVKFAYLGSINNIIDIDGICTVIKQFIDKGFRCELHAVGDGEAKAALEQAVKNTGCKTFFYGVIFDEAEKIRLLAPCDFAFNMMKKSVSVGLTIKSIDYLSYGLPLINNIPGDTWQFVEENGVGINIVNESSRCTDSVFDHNSVVSFYKSNFSRGSFEKSAYEALDPIVQ